MLGYKKPSNALVAHVDEEDKTTYRFQVSGSNYKSKAVFINESGLYALRTLPEKGVAFCDSLGGKQKTTIISESGLYALILSSKFPKARELTMRTRCK